MQFYDSQICRWLFSTPYRALERAYEASKRVRNIQKDYLSYKNSIGISSRRSWYNVAIYIDSVLNQSASQIYWGLLEFKLSRYLCNLIQRLTHNTKRSQNKTEIQNQASNLKKKSRIENQEEDLQVATKLDKKFLGIGFPNSSISETKDNDNWYLPNSAEQEYLNTNIYWFNLDSTNQDIELENLNRKLAWIEAVLADLDLLKHECWAFYTLMSQYNTKVGAPSLYLAPLGFKAKDIPYESLGLVPRSITRTLSRFQTELEGRSASLVLPEFRLAKYQAVASLQYMLFLILCPWLVSLTCKILFLESWIENWWNTAQSQVFLSFSQEEKALRRLQEVEELLWLDIIMADSSARQPQDLSAQIHQKTIDLVETYNQESIDTVLNLFTNFISVIVIISLLIWGKKRLAILNSWVQEVFYSLSDTMKAFFILLLTDLCIGFHSPHGWEIFIGFVLEHLGFSHNKHVISCFVSTFPVILDTVFKYWIFRHLNRISPSIVVSYHTMNE
jgi:hypothetical protein